MSKTVKFRLTGTTPLIVHNGQLADPLNHFAKAMKEVTSKRKKVDADHERLAELEFKGSLYVDQNKRPVLPSEGIEAIVVAGAKKLKEGPAAKAGVICRKNPLIQYDGPATADELWLDETFRICRMVKVGTARVMRTRPIFNNWIVDVELDINTDLVNESQVLNWLKAAGTQCGAFEWRPKYGLFTVEKL